MNKEELQQYPNHEIFLMWERRYEKLRSGNILPPIKVIKDRNQLDENKIGKVVTPNQLVEMFGQYDRGNIQTHAKNLAAKKHKKFAVSKNRHRYSREEKLVFLEVGKLLSGEQGYEIIYLGTGKAPGTTEIENDIAAESWGFDVLVLAEREKNVIKKGFY
jgi:hypothetical protein